MLSMCCLTYSFLSFSVSNSLSHYSIASVALISLFQQKFQNLSSICTERKQCFSPSYTSCTEGVNLSPAFEVASTVLNCRASECACFSRLLSCILIFLKPPVFRIHQSGPINTQAVSLRSRTNAKEGGMLSCRSYSDY